MDGGMKPLTVLEAMGAALDVLRDKGCKIVGPIRVPYSEHYNIETDETTVSVTIKFTMPRTATTG